MKSKWFIGLLSLILILLYGLVLKEEATLKAPHQLTSAVIIRIIDGDTLVVTIEGQAEKIRLIGVDTPEYKESGYTTATDYVKKLLPVGTTIYLESDISQSDKYNRLLRYVWLTPQPKSFSTDSLNGLLLSHHYGSPLWIKPDLKYKN